MHAIRYSGRKRRLRYGGYIRYGGYKRRLSHPAIFCWHATKSTAVQSVSECNNPDPFCRHEETAGLSGEDLHDPADDEDDESEVDSC